jgi:arylsulfatase
MSPSRSRAAAPTRCRSAVGWGIAGTGLLLCGLAGCAPDGQPDGVILVSIDTLRADHLGAYGSTEGLTPNLDRFAAESIVFDDAYAQSNETLYSHASMFSSRYPSEIDALDSAFRLPAATPTLASVFSDAGWSTAAFVAGGHLSAAFGLGLGFAVYDDSASWGSLRDTGAHALRWLDQRDDRPFFLFIHGYDPHDRYLKPPPFGYLHADPRYEGLAGELIRVAGATSGVVQGHVVTSPDALGDVALLHPRFGGTAIADVDPAAQAVSEADVKQIAGAYAGAVAWADASFGLLMAGLDARGLLDHTVVIVVSDHGEELGEYGSFNHRFTLSDATLHVPLMVHLPRGAPRGTGRHVAGITELVDVAPTIWALAGVHPPTGMRGHALLSGPQNPRTSSPRAAAYSEGAMRLLSVRNATARLTASGLSVENPMTAGLLAVAPVDGAALSLTGDAAQQQALRTKLVDRIGALQLARRTRK